MNRSAGSKRAMNFLVALVLVLSQATCTTAHRRITGWTLPGRFSDELKKDASSSSSPLLLNKSVVLDLRGGAKKPVKSRTGSLNKKAANLSATGKRKVGAAAAEEKQKSALSDTLSKYKKILPLTRVHITLVGLVTLLGLILGEELAQALLALDFTRIFYNLEIWRPFSAAAFLGPPSISWLMSGYYLFEYGSTLERAYGSAQHFMFIASQILSLTFFSVLTGQPFFAPSLITAMLHVLSRSMPHQKVKWLIFTVPYWSLPYGLMATDVLQAQSAMAALPHVLGILSGHIYFFHKFVWPKMGHTDWLVPPEFIRKRLDPQEEDKKESLSKAIKNRKKSKGQKLGSK